MPIIGYSEIIYLVANAFRIFTLNLYLEVFFQKKNLRCSTQVQVGTLVLYFILNSSIYLFIKDPIITISSNLILFTVLTLPYKSSIWKRIFNVSSIFMLGMICEGIIARTALWIIGPSRSIIIMVYVLSNFLFYLIVLVLKRIFAKRNEVVFSRIHWMVITIIPIISSVADIAVILGGNRQWVNVTVILALFMVNMVFFYLYMQVSEKYEVEFQNNALLQQNRAYHHQLLVIHAAEENIRRLQHDYKNHLIVLRELANKDTKEDLNQYIDKFEDRIVVKNEFVATGNETLDGLINHKLQIISGLGASMDVSIIIPKVMNMDTFDSVVLIGNLLDNAVSALQEQTEGVFSLKMKYEKGILFLFVRNSYLGDLKRKGNIFFTTKEDKINQHGMGLSNVRQIVEKYHGEMTIKTDNNFFEVEVLICI